MARDNVAAATHVHLLLATQGPQSMLPPPPASDYRISPYRPYCAFASGPAGFMRFFFSSSIFTPFSSWTRSVARPGRKCKYSIQRYYNTRSYACADTPLAECLLACVTAAAAATENGWEPISKNVLKFMGCPHFACLTIKCRRCQFSRQQ